MKIDFLKLAVLDDLIEVVTIPEEVRGASARTRSLSRGPRTRGLYLRWKSTAHPEIPAARHGRG